MAIDQSLFSQVVFRCKDGDALAEENDFDGAIEKYREAIALLPPPAISWAAGVTAFASLGDAYFWKGDYPAALEAFKEAVQGPEGDENPFVQLRLGQCLHLLGETDEARYHLMEAHRLDGKEIFQGEEEYLELIADRIG